MAILFLGTAARPFLLASSAFLHVLTGNDEHGEGKLEAQIIKKKTPVSGECRQTMFDCLVRPYSYSINCCLLRLSGESMKTRPQMSDTAAAQISGRGTIHRPSFLRPS